MPRRISPISSGNADDYEGNAFDYNKDASGEVAARWRSLPRAASTCKDIDRQRRSLRLMLPGLQTSGQPHSLSAGSMKVVLVA